jgi:hypothetical protein
MHTGVLAEVRIDQLQIYAVPSSKGSWDEAERLRKSASGSPPPSGVENKQRSVVVNE